MALSQNLIDELDMISNDNAFLNTFDNENRPFEQRTMFTRFENSDDNPILVAKPIFHLWTLFALQGELEQYSEVELTYMIEKKRLRERNMISF